MEEARREIKVTINKNPLLMLETVIGLLPVITVIVRVKEKEKRTF
jgi:hypothetical protein